MENRVHILLGRSLDFIQIRGAVGKYPDFLPFLKNR